MASGWVVEEQSVEVETSPGEGVSWRTLTSADRAPTTALTSGVCEIEPGGALSLHRHPPPEIYYVFEGSGIVTLDAEERSVGPGAAVFIPGGLAHAIRNTGSGALRFFYVFPAESYSDIEYTML